MCVFLDFYAMIDMLELEENLMWIFFFLALSHMAIEVIWKKMVPLGSSSI